MAFDPWSLGISGVVSLLGMLFGGKGEAGATMSDTQRAILEDSLNLQNKRMQVQNPLYEMTTRLATNLLPKSAAVSNPQLYNPYAGSGYAPPTRDRPRQTKAGDADYLRDTVRGDAGATAAPADPTLAALQALARGVQSPLGTYRNQMLRGRGV